jgi:hypothetical protein
MTGARIVETLLAVLGAAVVIATRTYPSGSHGVPGPALVPQLLGVSLVLVAVALLRTGEAGATAPFVRHKRAVPITMALLAAYALLWRAVPHGVLTGLVLLIFLRLAGTRWRSAMIAAAIMATTLQLLFERGLGVRFQ